MQFWAKIKLKQSSLIGQQDREGEGFIWQQNLSHGMGGCSSRSPLGLNKLIIAEMLFRDIFSEKLGISDSMATTNNGKPAFYVMFVVRVYA
ncbi:hypothetical protein TNCV_2151 [Trichonephila clavipes]|nr:hypothetical protein TNCV_2151 [Trichonephila clavipes]